MHVLYLVILQAELKIRGIINYPFGYHFTSKPY